MMQLHRKIAPDRVKITLRGELYDESQFSATPAKPIMPSLNSSRAVPGTSSPAGPSEPVAARPFQRLHEGTQAVLMKDDEISFLAVDPNAMTEGYGKFRGTSLAVHSPLLPETGRLQFNVDSKEDYRRHRPVNLTRVEHLVFEGLRTKYGFTSPYPKPADFLGPFSENLQTEVPTEPPTMSLIHVTLEHGESINSLLHQSPNATSLTIHSDNTLKDDEWKILSKFKYLTILNLKNCKNLKNINFISDLKYLTTFDLSDCNSLNDIDPLSESENIETLNISGCPIKSLRGLSSLKKLREIIMNRCRKVTRLDDLSGAENLRYASLRECCNVIGDNFLPLKKLSLLEDLLLDGCDGLTDKIIAEFASLKNLKYLSIAQSKGITDAAVAGIQHYPSLTTLHLAGCNLTNDSCIHLSKKSPPRLTLVNFSACNNISSEDLSRLRKCLPLVQIVKYS